MKGKEKLHNNEGSRVRIGQRKQRRKKFPTRFFFVFPPPPIFERHFRVFLKRSEEFTPINSNVNIWLNLSQRRDEQIDSLKTRHHPLVSS